MLEQYDKPFLTYEEMLQLMANRNLTISDTAFAQKTLSNYSYYTLINGYKNSHIMLPDSDCFVPGITFEDLYTLHTLDLSIHHILLKYILCIEGSLKSHISYVVSKEFGVYSDVSDFSNKNPADYLCRYHYQRTDKRNNTLYKLKQQLAESTRSEGLIYYRSHHNHIPPWILTTALSFGDCIMWYGILRSSEKEYVCNQFFSDAIPLEDQKVYLYNALEFLRKFRNKIAHGGRTFSLTIEHGISHDLLLSLSGGILTGAEVKDPEYRDGLLGAIFIIMSLLNDHYMIASLIADLYRLLAPYCEDDKKINGSSILELFSLPNDFFNRFGL